MVAEGLVGLLFLLYPGAPELVPGLAEATGSAAIMLIKMYGTAALTLALFTGFLLFRLKDCEEVLKDGLALFTFFHAGIATTQFLYNADIRPGAFHALMAVAFAYFWVRRW